MTRIEYELELAKIAAMLTQSELGSEGRMDQEVWQTFQGMLKRLQKAYPVGDSEPGKVNVKIF